MGDAETINGVPVTEQIAAWADEAAAGYDVEVLKGGREGGGVRGVVPSRRTSAHTRRVG